MTSAKAGGIPEVSIVTNGRLLQKVDLVQAYSDAGLDVFSITIHSADPKVHNRITGCQSWHETMRGIRNAVASEVKTSLNIVACPENIDSIPSSLKPLLDLGVAEIIVSCAIPRLCGDKFDGDHALDPYRFVKLIESLRDLPSTIVILHELPLCLLGCDLFLDLIRANRLGFGCHLGTGRGLSIDVDGRTIPCNSFPNIGVLDLFKDNNIRFTPEEFLELWNLNPELQAVRDAVNVYRSPVCEQCNLWEFCNCGCPLTWGHFIPEKYITDDLIDVDSAEIAAQSRVWFNP